MNYFQYYPLTEYRFGEETQTEVFRNIGVYVDILEDVENVVSLYEDYYIQDGERPDQVSFKLYGDPTFHWTFFFVNDKLKQSGWPVSPSKILNKLEKRYAHIGITTRNEIGTIFNVGETVTGKSSGTAGVVEHRNLDLGQIFFSGNPSFSANEDIESSNGDVIKIVGTGGPEHLIAHHYEDADGNWVDINPFVGPGADATAVSLYDMFIARNTELKQIKVVKPNKIVQIANSFKEAVKS